ncbi:hypothetical protein HPB50_000989 [Hyalomma asiaticum]|uniref:Uncharacterized protein n=1 Tax=Hyalomma asiaticum TaxID=266040 RepID=A0ACB7SXY6_HYAAI|nr:hypothetical protein HPB50_000989 [Hyalomma asiaticum]
MASSSSQRGYDPEEMAWSTISHSGNQASAPSEPIHNENLFRLVERRSQRRKANMLAAAAKDAHGERLSKQQTPSTRKEKGHVKPAWKPKPLPKFHPDDFVVVLKPRTTLALGATFQPGELGLSLRAYLGAQLAADLSFVLSREQNLIVASTKNAYVADRLLGDFVIKSAKGDVSLHGHLKESGEEVCHGVVTIANHETAETLKDSIQWRQGTILYIRKFGTSNKARLTFAGKVKPRTVHYNSEIITVRPYFRTVPACGRTHAPTHPKIVVACVQAPFVEGVRAPHECHVKCALCGGDHATNSKDCAAKYRKDTKMAPQKGAKNNSTKKPATRQPTHVTGGDDSPRQNDVNSAQAPPSGLAEKRGAAAPPPPHGSQGNQSRSQQQQPKVQGAGDARASPIKNDKKVSGTSRVASSSPSSPSPSRLTADAELHNVVASLRAQKEMLLAKIEALEKQSTRPPQPVPHAESKESEVAAPTTLESSAAALESRLENKIATMMNALAAEIMAQITNQFNVQVNAQVAEALPNVLARAARKGSLKDRKLFLARPSRPPLLSE